RYFVGDRLDDRLRDLALARYRDEASDLARRQDALNPVGRDELASERRLEIDPRERRKEVRLPALLGGESLRAPFDPARRPLDRFRAADDAHLDAFGRALHPEIQRTVVHDAETDVGMTERVSEL